MKILLLVVLLCAISSPQHTIAQDESTPFQEISLNDLSGFAPTAPNWQIVGGVTADRNTRHAISIRPGTGVLINNQTDDARGHLFTSWSHADLELDLEVLMPHGSNSGIYFQSRYEIQLLDSWGVEQPSMSDIGGIYQRWDDSRPEGQRGYEGHAPPVNVARAPGLWQHLNVVFRAPRFDASGDKIADARFVKVTLNGVMLHENVDVTGPTRAAAFEDEVPEAPIMIQGDHGPVAFRKIKYRKFNPDPVRLEDIRFTYYEGEFTHQMPDVAELTQKSEENVESITVQHAEVQNQFAVQHTGTLYVPRSGDYTFEVSHSARFRLYIDGNQVLGDNDKNVAGVGEFSRREVSMPLSRGEHSFDITYAKGLWHSQPTALGWYVSGPGVLRTELTEPGSLPADVFGAYRINPIDRPVIQRNFVMHNGTRRTHSISVGFPGDLHYSYDMNTGALLQTWKGSFVDTSTMWYQRGNMQSAVPIGSVIELAGTPTVLIADENSPGGFRGESAYRFKHYRIDDAGQPSYTYTVGSAEISDMIAPDPENRYFTRTLLIDPGDEKRAIRCILIESDTIEKLSDNTYMANDQQLYVDVIDGGTPTIQSTGDTMQLILPINGESSVRYNLIW